MCGSSSVQGRGAELHALVCVMRCRYEKRHANVSAHLSPAFRCKEGDQVVIGQCRCVQGW